MKFHHSILSLILIFCLSGCSWFSSTPTVQAPRKSIAINSGRIVNPDRLNEGGKLLLVPFRAGAGVEANDDLDKTALMLVRGVLDVIGEDHPTFELVYSMDDDPDFVLDGHIIEKVSPSKVKRWTLIGNKKRLKVKGKIVARDSGQTIVFFSDGQVAKTKKDDHSLLAIKIGQNIGRYVLSGLE